MKCQKKEKKLRKNILQFMVLILRRGDALPLHVQNANCCGLSLVIAEDAWKDLKKNQKNRVKLVVGR